MIVASDLPSFKETLAGVGNDLFFENGNAVSLANVIENLVEKGVVENHITEIKKCSRNIHGAK